MLFVPWMRQSPLQKILKSNIGFFKRVRYLEGVVAAAKESYYLVQLLHLYGYFPTVEALEKVKSSKAFKKLRLNPTIDRECWDKNP